MQSLSSLGTRQGLTWSTTVIMKIDLVGPARRGLAMGLNEFAGHIAPGHPRHAAASALGGVPAMLPLTDTEFKTIANNLAP